MAIVIEILPIRDCTTEFATGVKSGHLKKTFNCDLIKPTAMPVRNGIPTK